MISLTSNTRLKPGANESVVHFDRSIFTPATTSITASNRRIVIEYLEQQAAGDPSPAHTVGQVFDLTPAAVRQVCSRTLRKVRALLDAASCEPHPDGTDDRPVMMQGPRAA